MDHLIGPFIKKFATKNNYYIYDVNSNEILKVNDIVYDIIDDFGIKDIESIKIKLKYKHKISELEKNYKILEKAKKTNGYLSNHRPEIAFETKSISDIRKALSSDLRQLILDLTENCNLRCEYCSFSGRYRFNRTHGRKKMSFEIAKKSVDFFIRRIGANSDQKACISFYGGEPLLEFELIKKIINYVKDIREFDKFRFSITTNGTKMSEEIIEYFVNNNIFIIISLDGPEDVHNRYRVSTNGGKTFNVVMKNLKNIRKYSNEYFERNLGFNAILSPPYNFKKVTTFFYTNPLIKRRDELFSFSNIDPYETTFFTDFGLKSHGEDLHIEMNKLLERYKIALIRGNYKRLTIEKKLFDMIFIRIDRRGMIFLGKEYPPQGACFPGTRRLFVNTDGKYFMCEKVNSNFEIGDVDSGFYYNKISDFFDKYIEFFRDCRYCWALRLCDKCFNAVRKGSDFDEIRKKQLCINKLDSIERNLTDYCEIRESNSDAFRALDHIKIV